MKNTGDYVPCVFLPSFSIQRFLISHNFFPFSHFLPSERVVQNSLNNLKEPGRLVDLLQLINNLKLRIKHEKVIRRGVKRIALHVGAARVSGQRRIWVTKSCGCRAQWSSIVGSVD